MDYAEALRLEARGAHARFHEYVLLIGSASKDFIFLFFEGEDDPMFYNNFVVARLAGRDYREFICMGRSEVLRAHEMVARDGRGNGRVFFFIDKDHNDLFNPTFIVPASVYQTDTYSFENYLVCEEVLRRFWVERLRLSLGDPRFDYWSSRMAILHESYLRHCRVLMALVLVGRGIDGDEPVKLNLNNASLKNVFELKVDAKTRCVGWKKGAFKSFTASINIDGSKIGSARIREICKAHLSGNPKGYVRGKYEAWFFIRFLQEMTRALSDKAVCAAAGYKRAKAVEMVSESNFTAMVSSLAPCPASLSQFLHDVLSIRAAATSPRPQ